MHALQNCVKAVFYALVVFVKKWAYTRKVSITNDISIRNKGLVQ